MHSFVLFKSMAKLGSATTYGEEYEVRGRSSGFAVHLSLFSSTKLSFPQLIPATICKLTSRLCSYYLVWSCYHEQEYNHDNKPIILIQYSNQKDNHFLRFLIISENSSLISSSITCMPSSKCHYIINLVFVAYLQN